MQACLMSKGRFGQLALAGLLVGLAPLAGHPLHGLHRRCSTNLAGTCFRGATDEVTCDARSARSPHRGSEARPRCRDRFGLSRNQPLHARSHLYV